MEKTEWGIVKLTPEEYKKYAWFYQNDGECKGTNWIRWEEMSDEQIKTNFQINVDNR